jgi:AcrR family transcriptional regulator
VTSPRAVRPYHHGDLRRALLAATLAELSASGPSRLSLREVARRAGVSHAAPRHHFGDKLGLLTAVAADGYRLLADATSRPAEASAPLEEVGLSYVAFALAHPGHFAVMFRPDLYNVSDPDLARERDRAASVLLAAVTADLGDDAAPDAAVAGLIAAWSITHGFATLWMTGNLSFADAADPQDLARSAFAALRRPPRRRAGAREL